MDKEKKRAAWRLWYHKHKHDQNKKEYFRRTTRRNKAREWLNKYKATLKCNHCQIDNPIVLDFHHRNSKTKEFDIGEFQRHTQSILRLQKEIDKCDVLCSNCHRIEEHRIKNLGRG